MKQATKRFLSMLAGLTFFVGAFVVYYYFTKPAYEDAIQIRADLRGKREFIAQQKNVVGQVEGLINSYEEGPEGIKELIANALPTDVDFSSILAQANGLVKNSNLTMKSVSLSLLGNRSRPQASVRGRSATSTPGSIVKPLGNVSLEMELSGDYEDLKRLIETFQNNLRVFEVRSLSIKPSVSKTGVVVFGYTLGVVTYYQTL